MSEATANCSAENMTGEKAAGILSEKYKKAIDGVPKVSHPVEELADDYLGRYATREKAAKALAKYQVLKCGTDGFITGLGGLITLPVAIPANLGSVLYVQMRMVAAIAKMGGYDVRSDQVQTFVYMCLTGTAISDVAKEAGIQIGVKTLNAAFKKMPATALVKINQRVGFRLLTKFGQSGVVNLGKMIPLAGGVIGGGFDAAATMVIAKNAIKLFIAGEEPTGEQVSEEELKTVEAIEVNLEEEN
ncbi:EcsC family protein [Collinsella provencensis]|uniref:EcsC family protein n=1 Tax=Collinsella provencensis TaxID=1937461 RepID=UPI000C82E9BC|nr:EcsC family protein [Collinsella provencensis]